MSPDDSEIARSLDLELKKYLEDIEKRYVRLVKPKRIRVLKWIAKLREASPLVAWKRNRNSYARLLAYCVRTKNFVDPFDKIPTVVDLPPLPCYKLAVLRDYSKKRGQRNATNNKPIPKGMSMSQGPTTLHVQSRAPEDCQRCKDHARRITELEQELKAEQELRLALQRDMEAAITEVDMLRSQVANAASPGGASGAVASPVRGGDADSANQSLDLSHFELSAYTAPEALTKSKGPAVVVKRSRVSAGAGGGGRGGGGDGQAATAGDVQPIPDEQASKVQHLEAPIQSAEIVLAQMKSNREAAMRGELSSAAGSPRKDARQTVTSANQRLGQAMKHTQELLVELKRDRDLQRAVGLLQDSQTLMESSGGGGSPSAMGASETGSFKVSCLPKHIEEPLVPTSPVALKYRVDAVVQQHLAEVKKIGRELRGQKLDFTDT